MPQALKTNDITGQRLTRVAEIEEVREDEYGEQMLDVAFSSEQPVARWFGLEVLDHGKSSVDLDFAASGRAPLLLNHDPAAQIGVVEAARIDADRMGRARVRFGPSPLAQEIWADVEAGIRQNVSVGYRIDRMKREDGDDGSVVVRATKWTPLDISIVAVPADTSVGVGRSENTDLPETLTHGEPKMPSIIENAKTEAPVETPVVAVRSEPESQGSPPPVSEAERRETLDQIRKAEFERVAEITALGQRHNMADFAKDAVADGCPLETFRAELLAKLPRSQPLGDAPSEVGMSRRERDRYSLVRAIDAVDRGEWALAGFEREVSEEIAKRSGKEPRGFFVPRDFGGWGQRDLTAGTTTAGGHLVGTDHLGDRFLDALMARLVIRSLGAQVLSGLVGNVAVPAIDASVTAYWVAENVAPTAGAPTFRQVTLGPKTCAAYVDLSRRLLAQSAPAADDVVRRNMVGQVAGAIEAAAINGGDTNGPTGILATTGITDVAIGTNGGAITWEKVTELIGAVEADNVMGAGFLTNSKLKASMMSTKRVTNDATMILPEAGKELAGYPIAYSNHVPSTLEKGSTSTCSALIFADFSQMFIGEWGTLDVLVNPYTLSDQGATRITVFTDVDVALGRTKAFGGIKDLTT